jgi:putative ABC transport system permease protein
MILNLLLDTAVTGLPYVLPFLGVLVVFRLLDRIDLTLDGSFALGAANAASTLAAGVPAWMSVLAACVAGALAGVATTLLHLVLRVPVLLAGIVMWIGLYSINLRVMGRPTLALDSAASLYAPFDNLERGGRDGWVIATLALVVLVVLVVVGFYLRTESGLALRATGINTEMARSQGVDDRLTVAVGLTGANSLAALGGALVAHGQGFAEVNMGTGVLIAGIAAVLLGELVVRPGASNVARMLTSVAAGALLYRLVLLGALRAGLPASDLRLVTAVTLALALLITRSRSGVATQVPRRDRPRDRRRVSSAATPLSSPEPIHHA